jgi:wyosine [tRNA(Phe)-imidazoG37] synthetase (radical SAM superfamily)
MTSHGKSEAVKPDKKMNGTTRKSNGDRKAACTTPAAGFNHLFGPVPSRRLGRTLGIDLVPFKTCTFDCIYCQLGRTIKKTTERREYVPTREILDELTRCLASPHGAVDFCTLSGSGEPTLHSGLGRIISFIKQKTSIPVAVLTNGSLLSDREVRQDLARADVVLPTLAADSETVFRCVHRPDPSLTFARHLEGLVRFSREYRHHIWLELFLLKGITAMEKNVSRMNLIIKKIRPRKVQLNTASRPPCENFAFPVPFGRLSQLSKRITGNVEIVAENEQQFRPGGRPASGRRIAELILRRPCTVEDVAQGLSVHAAEASKILAGLVGSGRAEVCRRSGKTYFKGTTAA